MPLLKVLFIGDVVGNPGRRIVATALPKLRRLWELDWVVCNAENACNGSGLHLRGHEELAVAGVDAFTMGDHVYRKDDIYEIFQRSKTICRPANFPNESPGPELVLVELPGGIPAAVFTLLGRTFMKPVDCPFRAADRLLERLGSAVKVILVDFHAEATSDKQLMGRYLAGRVSAVLGTHTHVPTADEQILDHHTAYLTDVGMTGPYDSILGRRYDRVLAATLSQVPHHFDVATGDPRLCGALLTIDPDSGAARSIERVRVTQDEAEAL
ncbi:calcineurin-like phosphoesterase [Isosphaera pallida ATCC 43644]|jgi:metallophosphoesterase (TIGR00282 family)|uniref:Calcineurin-like phosphoesterase n=1 Tax=Isosphaera pallida (strain ATCC 43644 / DSM 9630 / IS1B) TaxID=575540 RepID=E8QXL8_ISOPI|nr:TIGR00282 family metallophosphoesterase [Isosphaera pallida]ADV63066.1 calcineurin-like phosphoesterase [Isosphaera pallida ATCC 43644]